MIVIGMLKTKYTDFETEIFGVNTHFRVLETSTHLFIYISQNAPETVLYTSIISDFLYSRKIKKDHKHVVFCSLKEPQHLSKVTLTLLHLLS
ncbi:hypothetical protein CWI37_0338p0010 [Hamiltosporidium tvaerminnensis]|uniref:Uncharacterized protein n=1 Tax=Hamiltosporidium tvaerminnensis TaxID=1176355 RepID=A0A4Q9L6N9_9MICR|nr:hypothetical protein CWI37_0338p0010 [Hamiltosporidium tvaerminnensis]